MTTTKKKTKVAKTADEIHLELAIERLKASKQFVVITMGADDNIQLTVKASINSHAALVAGAQAVLTKRILEGES